MSHGSKEGHLPQLPKVRLLLPYLKLNRPGFSKPSKARGQIPKDKYLKIFFKCLIITDSTLQSRSSSSCIFNCSFI